MFSIDAHLNFVRRAYSRQLSSILATQSAANDTETVDLITSATEDFGAFLASWEGVTELYDTDAFEVFVDNFGVDLNDADDVTRAVEAFESAYIGEKTPEEYAEDYVDESGMIDDVPELIKYHIDYEGIARDMVLGGDITDVNGYLFHSNW